MTKSPAFYILFILLLCIPKLGYAQQPKRDSIYQKIENFSERGKVSKFFYRLLFRDRAEQKIVKETQVINDKKYENKHIRKIFITSIDPLGYGLESQQNDLKWFENFGNRLHVKSKNFAVRGYLLFRKGDLFNRQELYESERILRDRNFVHRVSIYPVDSTLTSDSVDIAVRVLDSWSLKPSASYSASKLGIGLKEINFFGTGHELKLYYRTNFKTKQFYDFASYSARNIYGTYIDATISGEKDFDRNENVYFRANRDFFSPLTKWAGGFLAEYYKHSIQIPNENFENPADLPSAPLKVLNQDFWGGYQFQIRKPNSNEVTDNLSVSGRFQNFITREKPDYKLDPGNLFNSYRLFLGSVGFTQRKFKLMKNVFAYELPEDIPYGYNIAMTMGMMKETGRKGMPYAGISAGYGVFSSLGYFNYRVQYGSFFQQEKNYRSTFRFDGTYFTPVLDWKFANVRHFFSPTLVLGNKRSATFSDRVSLSAPNEFPEYNPNFIGNDKLVLRYQLQFFIKKSWKNFQINPYFLATAGWLSKDGQKIFSSDLQTKFGIGLHFYNPYLSFNRVQISIVYYPKIPFENRGLFDYNGYRNTDLPINNFTTNEPGIVNYGN